MQEVLSVDRKFLQAKTYIILTGNHHNIYKAFIGSRSMTKQSVEDSTGVLPVNFKCSNAYGLYSSREETPVTFTEKGFDCAYLKNSSCMNFIDPGVSIKRCPFDRLYEIAKKHEIAPLIS